MIKEKIDFQERLALSFKWFLPGKWFYPRTPLDLQTIKERVDKYFSDPSESGKVLPGCQHYHSHDCTVWQLVKPLDIIRFSGKMYFVIHLIPLLLFKRKRMMKEPLKTSAKFIYGWVKSLLFCIFYALIVRRGWCILFEKGDLQRWKFITLNVLATCAVLWEAPSRQVEIAMNVVPRYFESLKIFLGKMHLFPEVPMGRNLLLSLSMAIVSSCYFTDQESIKLTFRWLVQLIAGEGEAPIGQPIEEPATAARLAKDKV